MTAAVDWDEAYLTGRYRTFWELSHPSPDLAGFLAALGPADAGGRRRAALDVGCGTGRDAILLARAGYRASGLDISPQAIALAGALAAEQGVSVDFRVGDVRRPPYPDGAFDLITDRGCLHHLGGEDRRAYAAAVARLLRPGGLLYVRGCRVRRFPWHPVTAEELAAWFRPPAFEVAGVLPVLLVTDTQPIEGNAAVIRRR